MTMTTIDFGTPDAIWIRRDLYVKTPEALEVVLEKLRKIGYDVEDQRINSYGIREGRVTPEEMEQGVWILWHASLNIRTGKCGSCHEYISTFGIRKHGHTCEKCGEITYLDIVDDETTVRLQFAGDLDLTIPELCMRAVHWDVDNGLLYLHPEPIEHGLWSVVGERAKAYLDANADKWELVEYNDTVALCVRYTERALGRSEKNDSIYMRDIFGHHYNHSIVSLWEGEEYGEYGHNLPVPDSISIYEAWRWAPLQPSSDLYKTVISAARQVSDPSYYYQDGRPAWSMDTWKAMGLFVDHFTTLDIDEWNRMNPVFDGPGGVATVAAFCSPDAEIACEPNIGHALTALTGIDRSAKALKLGAAALANDPATASMLLRTLREE